MAIDKGAKQGTPRARKAFQRLAVGDGIGYGNGLDFDEANQQLSIDLRDTNPCLELDVTGIGVIVHASGGLELTATGLSLKDVSGTVFPTTGLYAGKRFWRTDLNEEYIYDGSSSWLGEIYTMCWGKATKTLFPAGTFQVFPVGNVTPTNPHGWPIKTDIKVIRLVFGVQAAWTGEIYLKMGATTIHTQVVTAVAGFSVDLDIDVDSHATNGMGLEGLQTSGTLADLIGHVLARRRIDT